MSSDKRLTIDSDKHRGYIRDMIRKGDIVRIKPEWQDKGDEQLTTKLWSHNKSPETVDGERSSSTSIKAKTKPTEEVKGQ